MRYNRHNVTGNYTRHLTDKKSLGFKLNAGTNDFYSSGQIPLNLVNDGELNRFGFIDPFDGGRIRLATIGVYYKQTFDSGDIFKLDGFLAGSIFDLWSNSTFFLNDPVYGDEIQQHDARLQQGLNTQYLHLHTLFGKKAVLTTGGNFHDNQINVGLLHTEERMFLERATGGHAHVTNAAAYMQEGMDLWRQKLHLDAGVRLDYFHFHLTDHLDPLSSGKQGAARWQPKLNISYTPSVRVPLTLYASYGRGISSQDARGVIQRPESPKVSTTDFYQVGTSHRLRRFSLAIDGFLINRSNEQVYIPDDGSIEFKGPSRSYGWEAKTSVQIVSCLSLNAGFTQVSNAFYLGPGPRIYVDSAPHSVGNAGLTLSNWRGFFGSLRYRHIGGYFLDGEDTRNPASHASGLDVLDLSVSRRIHRGVDLNFAVDNLNNKRYWETQNYFESQVSPSVLPVSQIHATPGYPVGFTVGLTFRFGQR